VQSFHDSIILLYFEVDETISFENKRGLNIQHGDYCNIVKIGVRQLHYLKYMGTYLRRMDLSQIDVHRLRQKNIKTKIFTIIFLGILIEYTKCVSVKSRFN